MYLLPLCLFGVLRKVAGDGVNETPLIGAEARKCYDEFNRPQRCIPEFENAAFKKVIEATNTCGENGPQEYCRQTGVTKIKKSCEICYTNQHQARYMTDLHNRDNPTWWQSESLLEFDGQVNLTLKFGKAYDITYVRLWFWSPRPESFYISKRTREDGPWIPFQYYSATCRDTYGLPEMSHTISGEEARALCTSEYSDISPLQGGNVAFGTLEGRPSAYYFDQSPELQEWVTSTEIRITLDRLNTFGDEVFGDEQVLKSYFYAVADFAVGARCKCNGHASECLARTDGTKRWKECRCEHNTSGKDCEECEPFHNDAPWRRATARDAHECKQCNCNDYSSRCFFDQELYDLTGHGGHCLDCSANRDGPNCERCREHHFMREDGYCIPCGCDPLGSSPAGGGLQCDAEGRCACKAGVTGDKCNRCDADRYGFGPGGCKSCGCSELGTDAGRNCDSLTGNCHCKENVEGKRCKECKPGFFNLNADNKFGCTPCFCYGHSSQCRSAVGFTGYSLESSFARSSEKWTAKDRFGRPQDVRYETHRRSLSVQAHGEEIYFVAPSRFLGDQRASYDQFMEFFFRIGDNRCIPSASDVVLEGGGVAVTSSILAQENVLPHIQPQVYRFRLNEHSDFGWQPKLTSRAFISLLANLTAVMIRATFSSRGVGFLGYFKLQTAVRGISGEPATWIENCDCPTGYVGQFCESCAPGFKHSPTSGGAFSPCVPCDCNNHASICDSENGRCICQHNTVGENCEFCARGYYGNALGGTPNDCQPCNCPSGGACLQLDERNVVCTECPQGYTGHHCDSCSDGYYGDPTGKFGTVRLCRLCECNQNIDPNAIGNCNTTTGHCLKCAHNTGGTACERCLPGYYGNALVLPKGDCRICECHHAGALQDLVGTPVCDQTTGSCLCKPHVVGRNCDRCEDGFFNLYGGQGCQSCNCDQIGSLNRTCDVYTGQCYCREGVTGFRCDRCESRKYGFSTLGCKSCGCDPVGSRSPQCDLVGRCTCLENVEGTKCDRCKENKHDKRRGCVDCPSCYDLVQEATSTHNQKLKRLREILYEIERQPTVVSEDQFPDELVKTKDKIAELNSQVKPVLGRDEVTLDRLKNIKRREKRILGTSSEIDEKIYAIREKLLITNANLEHSDDIIFEAEDKINEINASFDYEAVASLERAWQRAEIAGQQSEKMSSISHEVRNLADELDNRADAIATKAKDAKNKSIEAYNLAKDSNANQLRLAEKIHHIKTDLADSERKLNKTKIWTQEVKTKVSKVKQNATDLLSEAKTLTIPKTNLVELKRKSDELKREAHDLRDQSIDLFRDSDELRRDVDEKTRLGKELLRRAGDLQDETEDLRNDLVLSESQANAAIDLWNEVLQGAEINYKLLSEFDTQTRKNKLQAEAALKTIEDIEKIINGTITDTTASREDLNEARKNVDLALEKAQQANGLANDASSNAERVKHEALGLFKNTTALGEEADLMYDRVQNTEGQLKNLLVKTRSNESLLSEAAEKVGRAGRDTEEVSRKIQDLLLDVHEIMGEVQNSPSIDERELEHLEEAIRRTELRLKETRLEEMLEELQREHKSRNELIELYKAQIAELQKEVANVEEIVDALPEGCFKRVELEP